jgi:hypothetical protein
MATTNAANKQLIESFTPSSCSAITQPATALQS